MKTYSIRPLGYPDAPPVIAADAGSFDLTSAKVIKCLGGCYACFNASLTPGTPQFVPSNGGLWDIYVGSDGFTHGNFKTLELTDENGGGCVRANASAVCKNFRN